MLISTHAIPSTVIYPFTPVGWTAVANSGFDINNIYSITRGQNTYIAVGSYGKLATATNDVESWTHRVSSFGTSSIYSVEYGDGKFIAGGSTGKMAISEDGSNWTQINSSFGSSVILDINFYENYNLWVAVGGSGKLATSEDGENWIQRLSSFGTSFIRSLHSDGTKILGVGDDGKLATSSNGLVWTQRSSSFSITSIYSIHGNQENYVAVGDTGKIAYSSNGTSWIQSQYPTSFGSSGLRTVKLGNTETSAALVGGFSGKLANSFDFNVWTQRTSGFGSLRVNDLYYGEDIAIAVGNSGRISYSI